MCDLARTPYYWSSHDGTKAENDFMVELDGALFAIEAKGGRSIYSKSMRSISERFPWLRMVRLSPRGYKDQGWMRNIPLYAMASLPLWKSPNAEPASHDTPAELSLRQKRVLAAIKENPHITYGELSRALGVGQATIARDIATLRDERIIARAGSRKSGYWEILENRL